MNILFISKDLAGADLCYRLKQEGHNVRLFIDDKNQKRNLEGMVEKTNDWRKELTWVGKKGLIVFDSIGYGKIQDELRSEGYSVVGGNYKSDRIENNRQEGHKILSLCGIEPVPSINFSSAKEAIKFLEKNKGCWVVKQNGHTYKGFNYIGQLEDGSDVVEVLKSYARNNKKECYSLDLQKRVEGIEIGVARYFNGQDWVGPIEINMEHKNLCNDNLGPKTDEMGTLMWYDDNEKNKLFQKTLAKLKPYLQSINFKGDFDIGFIINGNHIYPLEVTARFGWPSTQLQCEIHNSPWGKFLKAVADGQPHDLKFKKGLGIVVFVATPPFPYAVKLRKYYPEGQKIFFKNNFAEKDLKHLHFEEISVRKNKDKQKEYYISSKTGYVLTITGMGKTVAEAREKTYGVIDKIIIPKMFYRTDIGLKFIQEDQSKLKKWGWI
jgi:phosphoribosylamine--glycine ligase